VTFGGTNFHLMSGDEHPPKTVEAILPMMGGLVQTRNLAVRRPAFTKDISMRIIDLAAFGVALALGCSKPTSSENHQQASLPLGVPAAQAEGQNVDLTGAGATFPYPLYSKWISVYQKDHPSVRINYQSIGSGGGIRQIIERTVDFGASDAPMTDEELTKAKEPILHLPMTLGAVVVSYNLPELKDKKLRLTPELISGIFMGEITKWNDDKIVAQNPGVKLPTTHIAVAYRSDGSGTTNIFTEYLATVVPKWKEKVGAGKSVNFPTGLGAKGNEGVSGQIKSTPGCIGYVELAYAMETGLPVAQIRNQAGTFVDPSLDSITAAAASFADKVPADMRTFLVNSNGPNAYPLAGFSYILIYKNQTDPIKGKALAEFLWWGTHDGQNYGPPLHYAKLPPEIVTRVEQALKSVKANDKPVLNP
jgi:phosphate transport system substrate-binding protein